LVHRLSPSLIDFHKFDKSDPIATMTTAFILAEELKIPSFLTPNEVVKNKDPRALLMYLTLFKIKIEESNKPPLQKIKNEIGCLTQMVTDCAFDVNYTQDQLELHCAKLQLIERLPNSYTEEIDYFKQRAGLMDEQVKQCFKIIDDLDLKNDLLFEENKILNEKVNNLKYALNEEQFSRKKAEEMLGIDQKILAIGNLLDPEGHTVDYYVKKFANESEIK